MNERDEILENLTPALTFDGDGFENDLATINKTKGLLNNITYDHDNDLACQL